MNSAGRTVSKFDKKGHGGTVQLDLGISKVVKAGPGDYTVRLTIDQRKDIVVEQALTVAAQERWPSPRPSTTSWRPVWSTARRSPSASRSPTT
ncbi:MAG: hypothetical protein R2715_01310 [Ilumatobacteraceae bacterium]